MSTTSLANQNVLVTATKIYTPADQALSSTRIFTSKELKAYGSTSVPDFLQLETGLYFSNQGAYGGTQTLKQRGLTGFTKIILDDVELEDPSSIAGTYQLQMMNLDQIESIEIINGASTTLYGTDSVAGVIKINTKKGDKKAVTIGVGSHATHFLNTYLSTKSNNITYRFNGSYRATEGISSYNKNRTFKAERDSFKALQVNPSVSYKLSSSSSLYASLYAVTTKSEIDSFSADQRNNDSSDFDNTRVTLRYQNRLWDDRWEYRLIYTQADTERFIEVPSVSEYSSKNKKIDFYNTLFWGKTWNTLIGVDYEYREATAQGTFDNFNEISVESNGIYLSQVGNFQGLISETSFRHQAHQRFKEVSTYKQSFLLPLLSFLKFRVNYGHSFRSPTLYQLSSNNYGNLNLQPTRIHTTEAGLDFDFEKHSFSTTYFNNNMSNFVDFDSGTNKYYNLEDTETQGLEFTYKGDFNSFKVTTDYTYTDVNNQSTNKKATYIPKEKLSFKIQKTITNEIKVDSTMVYVGRRYSGSSELGSYAFLNTSLHYKPKEIDYSLLIHNLLNKDYEDTLNFGTRGFSVYAWIQAPV